MTEAEATAATDHWAQATVCLRHITAMGDIASMDESWRPHRDELVRVFRQHLSKVILAIGEGGHG